MIVVCGLVIIFQILAYPNYFSWGPKFPERSELEEIHGSLIYLRQGSKGDSSAFKIVDHYGRELALACLAGASSWGRVACRSDVISLGWDWKKAIMRYHPKWGVVEIVVDGHPVQYYSYEEKRLRVMQEERRVSYRYLFCFSVIFFFLLLDYQLYRRKRKIFTAKHRRTSGKNSRPG
jgi:hypothetical protein